MKDVADIDIQTEIKLYDNVETQTFVERVDSQGYFFPSELPFTFAGFDIPNAGRWPHLRLFNFNLPDSKLFLRRSSFPIKDVKVKLRIIMKKDAVDSAIQFPKKSIL